MKESRRLLFSHEDKIIKNGFPIVAGIDEAGRGSLAGPVVAAAVIITKRSSLGQITFRDSKLMNEKKREKVFDALSLMSGVEWGIGLCSPKIIDSVNIFEATKIAMKKAILDLKRQGFLVSAAIIDGNFFIGSGLFERPVVKGDETVVSCKIAGIVAKVTRDRIMRRVSKTYPEYHFDKHKGYCTELHLKAIKKLGHLSIHRRSFVVRGGLKAKQDRNRRENRKTTIDL